MDLEQLIRQELADERHTPAGWAEPVQRVRTGIRRRRRRRYVTVAGLAALAVLATAGVLALPPAEAPPAQGVIAWNDTPETMPLVTRRGPRPDAPPCTDVGKPWLGGTGTSLLGPGTRYTMLIPNGRDSRCTMSGQPALLADGTAVTARTATPAVEGAQTPATVDPGEPMSLDVTVMPCADGQPSPYHLLAVAVDGRQVTVPGITELGCGFAVSPWYVQAPQLNAPLTVTMAVPATVERGTTLAYRLTVQNPYPRPFRLDPCPVYAQGIAESGANGLLMRSYRLNCSVAAVPRHGSLTYEMRLGIPANATPGPARITWTAVFGDGTVGIADLATGGRTIEIL